MLIKRIFGSVIVASMVLTISLPVRVDAQEGGQGSILIRQNSEMLVELLSPLSAEANKKDDKFSCRIISPEELRGAIVSGHVLKAKHSPKGKGKSEMVLKFDSITLEDSRSTKLNAQIKEVFDAVNVGEDGKADAEGTVKGKSRIKIGVKRAVVGGLLGAAIGGALAGPKGAVAGAAIGAGAAVSTVLVTEGPNLEFKQGTRFLLAINAASRL